MDGASKGRGKNRLRTASNAPVRLSDVATLAKVSAGTVSRVLSSPHLVSEETTRVVRAAIDKLGWVPHGAARALASHRTRSVGAIIPNLANPVFAQMIYAIQDALLGVGYTLVITCSEYDPAKALSGARAMIERGIDGLILLGENFGDDFWHLLHVQKIPSLVTYSYRPHRDRHSVGFDNVRAARMAADHLLDLGHRDFLILAQQVEGNDRAAQRLYGFSEAIRARGIALKPERIIQAPWSIVEGHQVMREVIAAGDVPGAVLCSNDYLAMGALAACQACGITTPGDVSIVGFDDLEIAAFLSPPLTTVRVPASEIGTRAAAIMVEHLERGAPFQSVEMQAELVVRASTAAPRQAASTAPR